MEQWKLIRFIINFYYQIFCIILFVFHFSSIHQSIPIWWWVIWMTITGRCCSFDKWFITTSTETIHIFLMWATSIFYCSVYALQKRLVVKETASAYMMLWSCAWCRVYHLPESIAITQKYFAKTTIWCNRKICTIWMEWCSVFCGQRR